MRGDRKLDRFKRWNLGAAWIMGAGFRGQEVEGRDGSKYNGFLNSLPFTTSMPFISISHMLSHSVLPSSRKVGMSVLISETRRLRLRERFV